ncbi:MAG: hypothetical protein IT578_06035 [Verrucomicrobiae bacterium]|nr:hypothetical protein [Verrucomicrobiae bacterium]
MSYEIWHYLHLLGASLVFLGYGALLAPQGIRSGMMLTGLGAGANLLSGFALLAKMNLMHPVPVWAGLKLLLWCVIAVLPVLAKRRILPASTVVALGALVGAGLTGLGWFKPF